MSIELQSAHDSSRPDVDLEKLPAHKVTPEDFEFLRLIGQGTETEIWRARYLRNGHLYAVKKVNKEELRQHNKVKQAMNEKQMLQQLRGHPGILSMYFTFQDDQYLYYCFELCDGGELREQLDVSVKLSLETARHYAAQLMDAICYMHIKGVIHRDITSSSIMLTTKGNIKIVSLTAAKTLNDDDLPVPNELINSSSSDSDDDDSSDDDEILTIYGVQKKPPSAVKKDSDSDDFFEPELLPLPRQLSWAGRAEYLPPETLDQYTMTYGCDWWAFGVILYEMLVGRPPFQGSSPYLVFQAIMNQPLLFPRGFDTDARDLIEQLLERSVKQRLGVYLDDIREIRYHRFFEPIWEQVSALRESSSKTRKHVLYHLPPPSFNILPDFTDDEDDMLQYEFDNTYVPLTFQPDPKSNEKNFTDHLEPGEVVLAMGTVIKNSKWSTHFFLKRRTLVLTNKPRLFYINPSDNEIMGEIPMEGLSVGIEDKTRMYINTPTRVYLVSARHSPRMYQPFISPLKAYGQSSYIFAADSDWASQWRYAIERAMNYAYLQRSRLLVEDRHDLVQSSRKPSLSKGASVDADGNRTTASGKTRRSMASGTALELLDADAVVSPTSASVDKDAGQSEKQTIVVDVVEDVANDDDDNANDGDNTIPTPHSNAGDSEALTVDEHDGTDDHHRPRLVDGGDGDDNVDDQLTPRSTSTGSSPAVSSAA